MRIGDYETHEAADCFPMYSSALAKRMADDIGANGLLEDIDTIDGLILEGRNRLQGCIDAGVEPRFREYTGTDPVGYVRSKNLSRRDLTTDQRRACLVDLEDLSKHSRNQHSLSETVAESTVSVAADNVAKAMGESPRTAHKAVILKKRSTKLHVAVKTALGDVTHNQAVKVAALPEQYHDEFEAALRDGVAAKKALRDVEHAHKRNEAAKVAATLAPDASVDILVADCLAVIGGLDDRSVSLLLTDPPYNVTANDWDVWETDGAYWEFMRAWLSALRPKMADDFTAFVFCDATCTVALHSLLVDTGWPVLRQAIWQRGNLAKKRSGSKTFMSSYEPFWHCGTRGLLFPDEWGSERFDVQSFAVPQSNHKDAAVHPTQKPLDLFKRLVTLGSAPGELVFDPFCGSGTTAVAAYVEGRPVVTCDTSEEYVQIAQGRIAAEQSGRDAA